MDQEVEKLKNSYEAKQKTERQRLMDEIAELRNQLNFLNEKLAALTEEWENKLKGSSENLEGVSGVLT